MIWVSERIAIDGWEFDKSFVRPAKRQKIK